MTEELQDPLKPFEQILEPDERRKFFAITLDEFYQNIANVVINDAAPLGVRQLFETAKNLVLYSWFVYRFHQPAELCAFGAFEMALASKAETDANDWWLKASKNKPPSLAILMSEAKRRGWLKNEELSYWKKHQQMAAWQRANSEQIENMTRLGIQEAPAPRFEDFKDATGEPDFDYLENFAKTLPGIRNNLAHGSKTLHPNSVETLELCAELINQLYKT